jgi:hypothetical protein
MLAKLSDEHQYWAGLEASASGTLLSHAVLAIQKLESATSLQGRTSTLHGCSISDIVFIHMPCSLLVIPCFVVVDTATHAFPYTVIQ